MALWTYQPRLNNIRLGADIYKKKIKVPYKLTQCVKPEDKRCHLKIDTPKNQRISYTEDWMVEKAGPNN